MTRIEELATLIFSELHADYPGSEIECIEGILRRGAMQWTHETPTVAGWYWWRAGKDAPADLVWLGENGLSQLGHVGYYIRQEHGQWAGPIQPPEEI